MRRTILCILLQTVVAVLYAQSSPNLRTFTVRDGLPANAITSVRQDSHGLIWVATWNGLCCYDGYQFTTFQSDPLGTDDALSTNRISAIQPDSRGNVWVRTYDNGLYLLDTECCQFFNVGLMVQKKYGETIKVRNIYSLPNGHVWVTDEQEQMNLRINDRHPLNIDSIEVWGRKGRPIRGTFIRKVETDAQGREWMITDQGMMRYGSKEFRKDVFTNYPNGDTSHRGSDAEAYVSKHQVGKHFIDCQGNLWYWSAHGLSMVSFRKSFLSLLVREKANEIRSVLCRRDGTIWAGGKDGVLDIYNAKKEAVGHQDFPVGIYAMMEDRNGYVWIGTRGNGIYQIAPDGKSTRHFTRDDNNRYSLSCNDIFDIDQDEQGNIWIATWGGGVNLVKNEGAEVRFLHKDNEMTAYPKEGFNNIRRITHTGKGCVLASTTWGLMTFPSTEKRAGMLRFYLTRHINGDTTSLQSSDVMQALVTKKGDVYVATMGGGIQQVTSKDLLQENLQLRIQRAMDQGAGNALSMTEDREGNIWITRESEINRYNIRSGLLERFDACSDGNVVELTEAKTIMDAKGQLWLGATDGVLTFYPQEMTKSQYRPRIIVTNVQYQGEQVSQPLLYREILDIQDVEHRNLSIRFAALDYGDNYLLQYAYRLDGDKQWNYLGRNPHISFNELGAGWHRLTIKSTNADGVWCDNETVLTLYVQPTLWERVWFRILVLLLLIGLSTWAVISFLRRRQQQKERERRLENIMRQYRELQESFKGKGTKEYKLSEPEIANPDEEMMDKLMAYIEKRIGDEDLKIDDMAEAVGMGRTVFYGKVRELVGVSPSDFLKQIRMQRAEQLISKSKMTFAEIAYSVGFTDPKYFTKCFKKQTGMTPSEYRSKESDGE